MSGASTGTAFRPARSGRHVVSRGLKLIDQEEESPNANAVI